MAKILLVDDHPIVRKGLRLILEESAIPVDVEEAGSGTEALEKIRKAPWDAVILDLGLPDRNGAELLGQLKRYRPTLPVLILTLQPEQQYGTRLLKAGASGYVNKAMAPDQLVEAVGKILRGQRYLSAALAETLAEELVEGTEYHPHTTLSTREYQIFLLLASAKTPPEIARELRLSVKTVYTYRERILHKMDIQDNAELASYAFEHGLLEDRRRDHDHCS